VTFNSGLASGDLVTFVVNILASVVPIAAFPAASVSAFGASLVDDADAAAARTTLGAQPLDATLTALAGLAVTNGDYIEATGTDTFRLLKLFITSISGTPSHAGQVAIVGGNAHMAIGTTGSGDWRLIDYRDTSIPEATAAEIADITDPQNTTLKYARKLIWDTTNEQLLRASGNAAADPWYVVGGGAITSISGTPPRIGQLAVVAGRAHIAIDTVGSGDWRLIDWRDTSIPVATAAAIADVADAENTTLKYAFKLIWDSTNKRMLRAAGGAAGDDWEVVDGSAQVTPT
jgi:hypothetical protein